MKKMIRISALLVLGAAVLPVWGQSAPTGAAPGKPANFDLGLMYTAKIAKISQQSNSNFVLNGASLDGVFWLNGKLGVAFDIGGETASNIEPGVNLTQFSAVVGPRYTVWTLKRAANKPNVYTQALVGFVAATNGLFVQVPNTTSRAQSLAVQTGGGLNWPINKKIGWRALEADYIYTQLGNNANNIQNDLRLSSGVTFHF
ncbi:MAG: hypothetical protein P4L03_09630 [Terracidiphilus sp.]|nr:hypothetical protein [Terracidiphilus sp.]